MLTPGGIFGTPPIALQHQTTRPRRRRAGPPDWVTQQERQSRPGGSGQLAVHGGRLDAERGEI